MLAGVCQIILIVISGNAEWPKSPKADVKRLISLGRESPVIGPSIKIIFRFYQADYI